MKRETDSLIARLAAEARPVRRLAPPAVRLALWSAVALAGAALVIVVALRTGRGAHLLEPAALLQLAINVVAVPLAAYAALAAAVPGRERRGPLYRWSLALGLLLAAPLVVRFGWLAVSGRDDAWHVGRAAHCAESVAIFGAIPGLVLLVLVVRALPLDRPRAGLLALLAWGFCGAVSVQVLCPDGGALHLLAGHWSAVAGLALAGLAAGLAAARWARS